MRSLQQHGGQLGQMRSLGMRGLRVAAAAVMAFSTARASSAVASPASEPVDTGGVAYWDNNAAAVFRVETQF